MHCCITVQIGLLRIEVNFVGGGGGGILFSAQFDIFFENNTLCVEWSEHTCLVA